MKIRSLLCLMLVVLLTVVATVGASAASISQLFRPDKMRDLFNDSVHSYSNGSASNLGYSADKLWELARLSKQGSDSESITYANQSESVLLTFYYDSSTPSASKTADFVYIACTGLDEESLKLRNLSYYALAGVVCAIESESSDAESNLAERFRKMKPEDTFTYHDLKFAYYYDTSNGGTTDFLILMPLNGIGSLPDEYGGSTSGSGNAPQVTKPVYTPIPTATPSPTPPATRRPKSTPTPTPTATPTATPTPTPTPSPTPTPTPSPTPTPVPSFFSGGNGLTIALIGIGVLAIAAVVVIVLLMKKKKGPTFTGTSDQIRPNPASQAYSSSATVSPAAYASSATVAPGQERGGLSLRFERGVMAGRSFPLSGTVYVGCDGTRCAVDFPDGTPGVSRVHCSFTCSGGSVSIRDEGSSYGTFVDGNRIPAGQNFQLRPGQRVSFGSNRECAVISN